MVQLVLRQIKNLQMGKAAKSFLVERSQTIQRYITVIDNHILLCTFHINNNVRTLLTYPPGRFAMVAPTAGRCSNSSDSSSPPSSDSVPRCNDSTRLHYHQPVSTLNDSMVSFQYLGESRTIVSTFYLAAPPTATSSPPLVCASPPFARAPTRLACCRSLVAVSRPAATYARMPAAPVPASSGASAAAPYPNSFALCRRAPRTRSADSSWFATNSSSTVRLPQRIRWWQIREPRDASWVQSQTGPRLN